MAADRLHAKSEGIVGDIKSALHGIHGAGEALRGGSMQALDGVFHKHDGEARNKEIADKGIAEMEPARERTEQIRGEHAHSHGVGTGHGQGSHFAKERGGQYVHGQVGAGQESGVEAGERIAMGAARKATMDSQGRYA
jgi:hypothetical protein